MIVVQNFAFAACFRTCFYCTALLYWLALAHPSSLSHSYPRWWFFFLDCIHLQTLKLILNIPTTPVQTLPHGGYQPYDPALLTYNNVREEDEEDEEVVNESDDYYRGHPSQYYPQPPSQRAHARRGYHATPTHSEDIELRSPGVARRFPRDIIIKESKEGGH